MVIIDKDLGEIRLVENVRARKIIVRKKENYLQLTHPPFVDREYIEKAIQEMKPRLLKLVERNIEKKIFTPETDFRTFSFSLRLVESKSTTNYYLKLKDGILSISCPLNTDFQDGKVQETIRDLIEKAFRYEAKRLFPDKVKTMARQYGFIVSDIKINKSRTRWGSCTSKKSINLSYYCMLLPEYLIDFIILHELCHTVEMNHSERFWKLLDKVSGGRAKEFTKELKTHKTNW